MDSLPLPTELVVARGWPELGLVGSAGGCSASADGRCGLEADRLDQHTFGLLPEEFVDP